MNFQAKRLVSLLIKSGNWSQMLKVRKNQGIGLII